MRTPGQYCRTVHRPAKPVATGGNQHIKTYESAYKYNTSSGRVGKAVSVQLSARQDTAGILLLQPIMLHSLQQAGLHAAQYEEQDWWEPVEDRLMIAHQQQNMPTAVEHSSPPEIQQQSEATTKPVLGQKSSDGCDIKPAARHRFFEGNPTVADPAGVSHTAVQASRDQDLASSKLPAGSKQDRACSAAVATTGKGSWRRRAVAVASSIVSVVVARKVGRHN
jgi:hypothetical protein